MVSGARHPRVSVVIPVHNGEDYLAQAIQSVLSQDEVDCEILVIDDASMDGTRAVASRFADCVHYVALPKQSTSIATTNVGIGMARGDYVAILHHDDYYLPGKLKHHVALMDANPNVALSYSGLLYVDPLGRILGRLRSPVRRGDYVVPGLDELRHVVVQNYINFSNAVVRRAAYTELGPYIEPLWVSSEWEMWVRLAANFSIGYIDSALVCYRLHPRAQTSASTTDTLDYQRQLQAVLYMIYDKAPIPQAVMTRRRFTQANVHLNSGLLMATRGQRSGALASFARVFHYVRPWEIPSLIHSSVLLPRLLSRVRLRRSPR